MHLQACKTLMVCPLSMRTQIVKLINAEIKNAKAGKEAYIIIKVNSLSDEDLILKLYDAAAAGVKVQCIIRGIFCAAPEQKKLNNNLQAISIVDEYLEHARVLIFCNGGKELMYTSSADWMVRNLDHRIEAAVPILDPEIKQELKDIIDIQLKDDVKARVLDNSLSNNYVSSAGKKKIRSQVETYNYLFHKIKKPADEVGSN